MDLGLWANVPFATPLWLTALALLALPAFRSAPVRAVAFGLLVLALAGVRVQAPGATVAIVVDVSTSASEAARAAAEIVRDAGVPAGTRWWFAAGDVMEVAGPEQPVDAIVVTLRSDLGRGLERAVASGARRVLLISDGVDTRRGDRVAEALAASPVAVDVLSVASVPNARVEALGAPTSVTPGGLAEVDVSVTSNQPGSLEVVLLAGEAVLERRPVVPEGGVARPVFRIVVPDAPAVELTARVMAPFAQPPDDDLLTVRLEIADPSAVLIVGDAPLGALLAEEGIDVEVIAPEALSLPTDAPVIVLRAPVTSFTPSQLSGLRAFVESGGGLMMTGGPTSFGLGGWYRTPLDAVLPVDADLESDVEVPLAALVMVVDRSQSMAAGSPSKLALAQRGAVEVVDLAFERDLLGLVAFNDAPDWVFELRPATSRGKREMIDAIARLDAEGGTILQPALERALDAVQATDAVVRHVIVLSDGRLYEGSARPAPVEALERLARDAAEGGVTMSTIAVGEQADVETLARLAEAGAGRFYRALDVATLPRIFASEALTASRSLLREDPPAPTVTPHPLLQGYAAPPAPAAYVATSLKASASPLWSFERGEALLAVHRYGLGRSAVFTSDVGAWLGDLGSFPELRAVLADVVRWLAARPDRFAATVDAQDGTGAGRFVLTAVEDGRFLDGLDLVVRGGGQTLPLEGIGAGIYATEVPPDLVGVPLVASLGSEVVARTRLSMQEPELRIVDGAATLSQLARLTGGRMIDAADGWMPEARGEAATLRAPFALLALVVFLAALVRDRWRSRVRGTGGTEVPGSTERKR